MSHTSSPGSELGNSDESQLNDSDENQVEDSDEGQVDDLDEGLANDSDEGLVNDLDEASQSLTADASGRFARISPTTSFQEVQQHPAGLESPHLDAKVRDVGRRQEHNLTSSPLDMETNDGQPTELNRSQLADAEVPTTGTGLEVVARTSIVACRKILGAISEPESPYGSVASPNGCGSTRRAVNTGRSESGARRRSALNLYDVRPALQPANPFVKGF